MNLHERLLNKFLRWDHLVEQTLEQALTIDHSTFLNPCPNFCLNSSSKACLNYGQIKVLGTLLRFHLA
jgi:hypothetical protein